MKISRDSLIAALLDQRFYLLGDAAAGVGLYCRDCRRKIAHYGLAEGEYRDPKVAYVEGIPTLWTAAASHLAAPTAPKPDGSVNDA